MTAETASAGRREGECLAALLGASSGTDAELARLLEAWPKLSAGIRSAIAAMARAGLERAPAEAERG